MVVIANKFRKVSQPNGQPFERATLADDAEDTIQGHEGRTTDTR